MLDVLLALGPIFLLILIGLGIKRKNYLPDDFWSSAELLTYYVFFPALLLKTTVNADMGDLEVAPMAFAIVSSMIVVAAMTTKLKGIIGIDGPSFTSLFQGSIRFNTYVGIAVASALWGNPGVTLIAVAVAICVPLVNVLCVIVMETYGASEFRTDSAPKVGKLANSLVRNPLILACILGLSMNGMNAVLPPIADSVIDILARASLPIGLLCVGAGLHFGAIQDAGKTVIAANVIKLIILPALCLVFCNIIGVEGLTRDLCVFFCGLPVATSSYVLARKMGGNAEAMSGIITLTTLCAMVTLPLILIILEQL